MNKKRIVIICGGKSVEHEISVQSTKNVIEEIDKKKYQVILLGITKKGSWVVFSDSNILSEKNLKIIEESSDNVRVTIDPGSKEPLVGLGKIDAVFPITHGTYGEDGALQGLLKTLHIPFVGPSILGSSASMDKDMTKRILKEAGLPVVKGRVLNRQSLIEIHEIIEDLGFPLFVKPANLGSSVGVTKAHDMEELKKAIDTAFQYDTKILIEEGIDGREIECAILGNEEKKASVPGEIIVHDTFYSYDAKYLNAEGASLGIPADIPEDIVKKVQEYAVRACNSLEVEGMSRVDFFLDKENKLYINEINTIPGFTKISMYPKLWEISGISYTDLIDHLLQLAIARFEREQSLETSI